MVDLVSADAATAFFLKKLQIYFNFLQNILNIKMQCFLFGY